MPIKSSPSKWQPVLFIPHICCLQYGIMHGIIHMAELHKALHLQSPLCSLAGKADNPEEVALHQAGTVRCSAKEQPLGSAAGKASVQVAESPPA